MNPADIATQDQNGLWIGNKNRLFPVVEAVIRADKGAFLREQDLAAMEAAGWVRKEAPTKGEPVTALFPMTVLFPNLGAPEPNGVVDCPNHGSHPGLRNLRWSDDGITKLEMVSYCCRQCKTETVPTRRLVQSRAHIPPRMPMKKDEELRRIFMEAHKTIEESTQDQSDPQPDATTWRDREPML